MPWFNIRRMISRYLVWRHSLAYGLMTLVCFTSPLRGSEAHNLILITLDGVRGQELFQGVDGKILKVFTEKKSKEGARLRQRFWDPNPTVSRAKIMPFFWGVWMQEHGSVVGNAARGSVMKLTNRHRFSYPGYSETLVGKAYDDLITSNDPIRNPHPTALEFLRQRLGLAGRQVAVFASWEVLNPIASHQKDAFFVNAGYQRYDTPTADVALLSELQFESLTPWDSVRHDVYTFRFAMDYLRRETPRILYLSLGETDDWAHDTRYDRVLQALHRTDSFLRELWDTLQSHPQYRDQTTLMITTDHGRGNNEFNWVSHNHLLEGADATWLAVISPSAPQRGELSDTPDVFQNQIAATMCQFMGLDYNAAHPEVGRPMTLWDKKK